MGAAIEFLLANFTLNLFVIGLIVAGIAILRAPNPTRSLVIEKLFAYFLLFSIFVSYFYNFVAHVFFGDYIAKFIGWAPSPFQAEVGFASLGFAVVGLLAFFGDRGLRIAAVVGPTFFLWGAAGGHIYQMVANDNFAPGNAGVIFWTDILIPIVGLAFLWLQRDQPRGEPGRI